MLKDGDSRYVWFLLDNKLRAARHLRDQTMKYVIRMRKFDREDLRRLEDAAAGIVEAPDIRSELLAAEGLADLIDALIMREGVLDARSLPADASLSYRDPSGPKCAKCGEVTACDPWGHGHCMRCLLSPEATTAP